MTQKQASVAQREEMKKRGAHFLMQTHLSQPIIAAILDTLPHRQIETTLSLLLLHQHLLLED